MGGVTAGKGRRSRQGARGEKQMTLSSAGWKKTTNGAAAMSKAVEGSKKEQMFLDFGQQSLGKRVLCQRCGMLHVCGSEEDEAGHAVVCAKAAKGVEFAGWKQLPRVWKKASITRSPIRRSPRLEQTTESQSTTNMSSPASTSSISPSATAALSSRLDDMGRFMIRGKNATFVSLAENGEADDGDLGTVDDNEVAIGARELRGAMSTDSTPSSILSLPIPAEAEEEVTPSLPRSALACEEQKIRAVVGILQMWVHGPSRREGIATRLVDTVRGKMVYGCLLRRDQIAFLQPTREGQAFASRYSGGDLLVY